MGDDGELVEVWCLQGGFWVGEGGAVRSGIDDKFQVKIMVFPVREGGGGAELEICLSGEAMAVLVADTEFMEAVQWEFFLDLDTPL